VETQVLWRSALAKVLAARGRVDEGEVLAREAAGIIEGTDQPDAQGGALVDLGRVLAMAGRTGEAISAFERAIERFEVKGNVVWTRKASAMLADIVRWADDLLSRPGSGTGTGRWRPSPG
jgi:hypothetical protein